MNKYLIILSLLCASTSWTQETKVRKNLLDISFHAWTPEISNQRTPEFNVYKDGNVVPGKDVFDWGTRIGYTRMISQRLGVGLEGGIDFFSIHRDTWEDDGFSYENIDAYAYAAMPKLSFYGNRDFWPGRFVHQAGIGMWYSDMVYKQYYKQKISEPAVAYSDKDKLEFRHAENLGFTFMYSLGMQKKIGDHLAFHYGARLVYNYMPRPSIHYQDYSWNYLNSFSYHTNQRMSQSWLRAYAGLTFTL